MKTTTKKTSKARVASKTASKITGQVIEEPNGSFTVTGQLGKFLEAAAAAEGITIDELADRGVKELVAAIAGNATSKKNTVSLDLPTCELVAEMAKEAGLDPEEWLERLIHDRAIPRKRPIWFPAETVALLEELLEASGTALTVEDYAEKFLSHGIKEDSFDNGFGGGGVPMILDGEYDLEPGDMAAMKAVVERWKAKEAVAV